jgi:hypothetical protein
MGIVVGLGELAVAPSRRSQPHASGKVPKQTTHRSPFERDWRSTCHLSTNPGFRLRTIELGTQWK